jgi:hypothetical protein
MRADGSVLLSDVLSTALLAPHVESVSPGSSRVLSAHMVPASLLQAVETIVCTSFSGHRPRFELDKHSPTEMWIRATTKVSMPVAVTCGDGGRACGDNLPGSLVHGSERGDQDAGGVEDSDDPEHDGDRRVDWLAHLGDDRFSRTDRASVAPPMLLKLLPADAPPGVREYLNALLRPTVHYAAMCA